MSESELEKAVKEIKKNVDIIIAHKNELDSVFGESKETDKKERKFQVEMLKIQLGNDVFASIISVIMSIMVAIIAVIITISIGFSNIIPAGTLAYFIISPIAVAIATISISWAIFGNRRNRRIKDIEEEFIESKDSETKVKQKKKHWWQ